MDSSKVHDSHPYRNIDSTNDLYRLYFKVKLILLIVQIFSSLTIADIAVAIRILISPCLESSFLSVAPKYLN